MRFSVSSLVSALFYPELGPSVWTGSTAVVVRRGLRREIVAPLIAALTLGAAPIAPVAPPAYVDITWMSVTNMSYEVGPLRIVTDGYMDKWRLDPNGVRPIDDSAIKRLLGFALR